jgi:hypothetical protein
VAMEAGDWQSLRLETAWFEIAYLNCACTFPVGCDVKDTVGTRVTEDTLRGSRPLRLTAALAGTFTGRAETRVLRR